MYRLCEERDIEPETMANLVSSTLYGRRFGPYYVSPVVAGINQRTGKPFICGFDSIGSIPLPDSLCCPHSLCVLTMVMGEQLYRFRKRFYCLGNSIRPTLWYLRELVGARS